MAAAEQVSQSAVLALKSGRLPFPPLAHPDALVAAAAKCKQLGVREDTLNAAVLAAGVLQAHILNAQGVSGQAPPPPPPMGLPPSAPPPPAWGSGGGDASSSALLSEQAKQAMAAAQATNKKKEPRKEEEEYDQLGGVPIQVALSGQNGSFIPGILPLLPQNFVMPPMPSGQFSATAPGQVHIPMQLPPPLPLSIPRPGGSSIVGGGCAGHNALSDLGLEASRLQNNVVAAAAARAGGNLPGSIIPPPSGVRGPLGSSGNLGNSGTSNAVGGPGVRGSGGDVFGVTSSSSGIAGPDVLGTGSATGSRPPRAQESGVKKQDEEQFRCHLHRKPQANCKICQRMQAALKKDDSKDASANARSNRDNDDDENGGRIEAFEITNKQTFNFAPMLRDQILKNTYFKTLVNIETFEGVVDELYQFAETAEVYAAGGQTVPSTLFCCLFRLFTIGISYEELQQLLESRDQPYVRCCGILYIRFGCAPEKLWEQLGDYTVDDQEFEPAKSTPNMVMTIGEYVETLLMDERYYYTALPRIPVGVKKKIEENLAPLEQYRRRTVANKKSLHFFKEPGAHIEARVASGEWVAGTVVQVVESIPTRIMVRVRLETGREEVVHLGRVILREKERRGAAKRSPSRSRSRSPKKFGREGSPDWTRHRGKSQAEMVQELRARQRERAVCSSGKDYHRRPIGFMSGLAMKRDVGVASTRLREEETYAPRQVEHRKQLTEEEEMEQRKQQREKELHDMEKNKLMQQLFEKYGASAQTTAKTAGAGGGAGVMAGEEQPEVLRLGLG